MNKDAGKTETADRPLLGDLQAQCAALGDELRAALADRWELARLEIEADLRSAVRLAIVWSIALLAVLTAFPLAATALAESLDGLFGVAKCWWLLILAACLLASAALGGYCAWRRFRRKFIGLRETFEELREDALWLREKGR